MSVEAIHYVRCDNQSVPGRCERRTSISTDVSTPADAERRAERERWLVVEHPNGETTHLCPQHRPSRLRAGSFDIAGILT